ncbi:GtrA family protein [Cryobacterium sp. TMS1-20-1]|uniref:GtrA family protein n=1 Tax=unclassified Cryobacterium TaxID=2649013 RepID=UPI00106C34D2|nr:MULTISPECIES: GtrA family protein [unclassified Cryobacterium]TFC72411.1 GtrA family protein [Cryobacterium sp. TMS1-20-1]TFD55477.1 GtrA family protein [Cryobacterium sp. Hh7]
MSNPSNLRPRLQTTLDSLKRLTGVILRDQRVRFLIVGGTNTVVGFGLYTGLWLTIGHVIGYLGSLYGSYALASLLAFNLYRRFVFHVRGNVLVDFLRFQGVYVVSLVINTVSLPLLVELLGWSPLSAQAVIVVVTTTVSYVGHKFFSFRRRPLPFDRSAPDTPSV